MQTPDRKQGILPANIYSVDASDPMSELIDRSMMHDQDIAEIDRLMAALATLRRSEEALTEASLKYMKLNKTDMRALHFLIVAQNSGDSPKPRDIAAHLGISTASTTKLLDRLETGGHVVREIHPTDRRAQIIRVTSETRIAAMRTVGKQQAKRFHVATRFTSAERTRIAEFLETMATELEITDENWDA